MEEDILPPEPYTESDDGLRNLTLIVYVLQGLGFFNGLTFIAGVMINYIKREDAENTIYASHFAWQIRTFWWGLAWAGLATFLYFILVGFIVSPIIFAIDAIWVTYRIIKGLLYWNDKRPMPSKDTA